MKELTKERAIALVDKHKGRKYDYTDWVLMPDWTFKELAEYNEYHGKESDDYPLVCNDMEELIDSCGFKAEVATAIKSMFIDEVELESRL